MEGIKLSSTSSKVESLIHFSLSSLEEQIRRDSRKQLLVNFLDELREKQPADDEDEGREWGPTVEMKRTGEVIICILQTTTGYQRVQLQDIKYLTGMSTWINWSGP